MKGPLANEATVDIPSATGASDLSRGPGGRSAGGGDSISAPERRAVSHKRPAGSCLLGWHQHIRNGDISILPVRGVSQCNRQTLQPIVQRPLTLCAGDTDPRNRNLNFAPLLCLCDSKSVELHI